MTPNHTVRMFCAIFLVFGSAFNALAQEDAAPPPPSVSTVEVVTSTTPIERDYPARMIAAHSVLLQAEVGGKIIERAFTEGAFVERGDLLYVIDPESYQIALDQARARVRAAEADLSFAQSEVERNTALARDNIISPRQLQRLIEQQESALASAQVAMGEEAAAELALRRTRITAPLAGRMGLTQADVGDLVAANQTPLATLVQWSPIEAQFRPPASDLPLIETHHAHAPLETSVFLSKSDSDDDASANTDVGHSMMGHTFADKGVLDFIDSEIAPATDTILMRANIPNLDGRLRPGQFARVRVHISERESLLVPRAAVHQQQDGYLLYIVDESDMVQTRDVKIGDTFGSQRIILEGVENGERVIVSNVAALQEGMQVVPQDKNDEEQSAPSQP